LNILIAIIHNNDLEKKCNLRENVNKLTHDLNDVGVCSVVKEYGFQPNIKGHSYVYYLKRSLTYEIINYEWVKYRNLPFGFKGYFQIFRNFISKSLSSLFNNRPLKFSEIETFVTDKHLRAWFDSLEDFDGVLVFEDDAFFNATSIERFLSFIKNINVNDKLYADLAGGLDRSILRIEKLINSEKISEHFLCYDKIVTNTACCYFISKPLLKEFCSILISKPTYRHIGIDWLINKLSISLENKKLQHLICYHAEPPIFQHGSFTGKFESWQKKD
jgi:hypothetical protein